MGVGRRERERERERQRERQRHRETERETQRERETETDRQTDRQRLYTCRYTVTTRKTPALRWAAMRAILMCHKTVSKTTTFQKRSESRSGIEPILPFCLPARRLTARPNRLTYSVF